VTATTKTSQNKGTENVYFWGVATSVGGGYTVVYKEPATVLTL
jgi:hypothetical protein